MIESDGGAPDGAVALAAGAVDGPHPVDGLADAAARPVEGRRAHVAGLLLPLAVCNAHKTEHVQRLAFRPSHGERVVVIRPAGYLVA
jgi:hypothetical protein